MFKTELMQWTNDQPIYQQVRNHVVSLIIDGVLDAGDSIPSVRQMAVEGGVNPLTVSKAYQELVDLKIVEKRRGLGSPAVSADSARETVQLLHRSLCKDVTVGGGWLRPHWFKV